VSYSNSSVLVLGESNVGKTIYAVQLYGRLQANLSPRLKLFQAPQSVTMLDSGMRALNKGELPEHNPSGDHQVMDIPTQMNSIQSTLRWPDFAGEQISKLIATRHIPASWERSVEESDAWMLFLRLDAISDAMDALKRPAGRGQSRTKKTEPLISPATTLPKWNSNAKYVELFQMLLSSKRMSTNERVSCPPLVVMISCWDEMQTTDPPMRTLEKRLPLLHDYLHSTWQSNALEVFGVSSLGMALTRQERSEALRDEGPERHGYVIRPDGNRSPDLAEPVVWLMEQL
jgi:GTPase SAR1 family protein